MENFLPSCYIYFKDAAYTQCNAIKWHRIFSSHIYAFTFVIFMHTVFYAFTFAYYISYFHFCFIMHFQLQGGGDMEALKHFTSGSIRQGFIIDEVRITLVV